MSSKSNKNTKYIFVTGGVISGVGKGITAASIGAVLKAKNLRVSMQKCDPYFNIDAGLLNPAEHGECFVTFDGAETDLDLGSYERFLNKNMSEDSIVTSGKLFKRLLENERAGKFHGKSVQMVPHFTGLIQDTFEEVANKAKSDIHIVEIGGSIGDLESGHFVEAIREFSGRVGRENCFYIHVVFVPYLSTSHEFKTKPAQNALRDLRETGIIPDMVVVRADQKTVPDSQSISKKLSIFSGVKSSSIIVLPNSSSVYEVPLNVVKAGALKPIDEFISQKTPDMSLWKDLNRKISAIKSKTVKVGLVAKYIKNTDTYLSVTEALKSAAWANNVDLEIIWINAETTKNEDFATVDGILVPGGFGTRGVEGKISAATYALKNNKPYLGLCLGLQVAVIAAARIGGLSAATSEEIEPNSPENIVYIMDSQKGKESTGGTLRLGDYKAKLLTGSLAEKIYGTSEITERHRHRYEVNQSFTDKIQAGGLTISGLSPDGKLVEFVESPRNDFFIATQAHPEFKSRPAQPHPLFDAFIKSLL